MRCKWFLPGLISLLFFAFPSFLSATSIGISQPICLALKGCRNAAIFMTIHLPEADVLKKAEVSVEIAERTELHTHEEVQGIMKMKSISEIKAEGGALELKRGGFHIMLIGLVRELKPDTQIPLTLHFQKAGKVSLKVPVQEAGWRRKAQVETPCCHQSDE